MRKGKDLYKNLKPYLNCIDYTVSKESYEVMYNEQLNMLVTSPLPKDLHNYYESTNYISHTDSRKSLVDKVYQLIKKYSLRKKLNLINSFGFKNKTILDVGAGTGEFIKYCSKHNWESEGMEPSEKARLIALKKEIQLKGSLEEIPDKEYNIITLWHALEHITELHLYIDKLKKSLSKNGKLIVAVPNFESYDASYYKQYWAAYDVPRHVWHFSKISMNKIFKFHGLKIIKIRPMLFDSFYVSLLSEKYKSGKINYIKAFYIGLKSNIKAIGKNNYSSLIYIIEKKE